MGVLRLHSSEYKSTGDAGTNGFFWDPHKNITFYSLINSNCMPLAICSPRFTEMLTEGCEMPSFLEKAPPESVKVIQRATKDLKNSGILDKVLKVGESAPEFSLPDENGNLVALTGLLARGPVVISFYRGQW